MVFLNAVGVSQYYWCFLILLVFLNTASVSQYYCYFSTLLVPFSPATSPRKTAKQVMQKILVLDQPKQQLLLSLELFAITRLPRNVTWENEGNGGAEQFNVF